MQRSATHPAQPLLTPSPRQGSGAPARACFSLLLGKFQAAQPPLASSSLIFFPPAFPELLPHGLGSAGQTGPERQTFPLAFCSSGDMCPREGARASLAGAGGVVSGAGAVPPAWQLKSPARASSLPHPSGSRGDFPAGRAQGTDPGTCCGSHAQLRAKTAAGGGRLREEEERDLLGMPPHSQPAPSPAT